MDRQTEKQKQTDGRTELTSILEVKCMFCSNLKGAKTASLKLGCVVPYSCLFLNIPTCKLTELSSNWFITAFARKKPQMILIICYNKHCCKNLSFFDWRLGMWRVWLSWDWFITTVQPPFLYRWYHKIYRNPIQMQMLLIRV